MKFGIRTVMLLTAAFAIAIAAIFVFPRDIAAFVLIYFNLIVTSAFLAVVIYDEGWWRAFAVGALVPFIFGAVFMPIYILNAPSPMYSYEPVGSDILTHWNFITARVELLKTSSATIWSGAIVAGLTSMLVRSLVRRGT